MKTCVFTGTRAEFGILTPLLELLKKDSEFELQLFVSGTHLETEFGHTIDEINKRGFRVDAQVPIIQYIDSKVSVDKSFSSAMASFADELRCLSPDLVIIVGDRYEALAMAISCLFLKIPLAHIHGGEISEGAIDESIRHSITKMSQYHFTSTEGHRLRVCQLGEDPKKVWTVGAPGLDSITSSKFLSKQEIAEEFMFSESKPLIAATIHPETSNNLNIEECLSNVFSALDQYNDFQVVWTKSNADSGGDVINKSLSKYCRDRDNHVLVSSLGAKKYFSLVKASDFVIGNSSSGLIEVPALGVPTINIGDRQKGRLAGKSVIHSEWSTSSITRSIKNVLSPEWREGLGVITSPYGDGQASKKILSQLKSLKKPLSTVKPFFDIEVKL